MIWLRILVALLDIYLLLSLGSWFVLRYLQWSLLRSGRTVRAGEKRLAELRAALNAHLAAWPREPRPGRYTVPDQLASEHLAALRGALTRAETLLPSLSDVPYIRVELPDALALRTLAPLPGTLRAWTDARALWALVHRANASLAVLEAQAAAVRDIPSRTRGSLNELRAEVTRLSAVLEGVQEQGMAGLEQHAEELATHRQHVEMALDRLGEAQNDPQTVYEVDKELHRIGPALQRMDQLLTEAAEAHGRAQSLLARIYSALRLAEERWSAMAARGATEPDIAAQLDALCERARMLPALERSDSLERYRQLTEEAIELDSDIQALMTRLDAFERTIRESRDALSEMLQEIERSREACVRLQSEDATVEPDASLILVDRAREMCAQAEAYRREGTTEAYRLSVARAAEASKVLGSANAALRDLPDKAARVRGALAAFRDSRIDALRERRERACEALQDYPVHWERRLRVLAAEADSALDAVADELAALPEGARGGRHLRQSELDAVAAALERAEGHQARAEQLVAALEGALTQIARQQEQLESAIEDIAGHKLPALEALQPRMLPELRQRLELLKATIADESAAHADPAQVDYDVALETWLPDILRQIDELAGEHRSSVRHYRKLQHEALRRMERLWNRLERLDPYQLPAPEQNVKELGREVDRWRAAVAAEEENPAALSVLLSRDALALERRVELVLAEVEGGRQALVGLSREYLRLAESVARSQAAIEAARTDCPWSGLTWDASDAEAAWLQAQEQEQETRSAKRLSQVADLLQRAVNDARRSEQLYTSIERRIGSALSRLGDELQAVQRLADRGRRLEAGFRQEGRDADADEVAALLARADRALQTAQSATTFEDTLRHLRAARTSLDNI